MALCVRKEDYEKLVKREPEQDFYDCWRRVAAEIKRNETARNTDEEFDDYDDQWEEWNDFNRQQLEE